MYIFYKKKSEGRGQGEKVPQENILGMTGEP